MKHGLFGVFLVWNFTSSQKLQTEPKIHAVWSLFCLCYFTKWLDYHSAASLKCHVSGTLHDKRLIMSVCLGLTSLLNIWGHIATVPACSSGTLTNMLPYGKHRTWHPDRDPSPTFHTHTSKRSILWCCCDSPASVNHHSYSESYANQQYTDSQPYFLCPFSPYAKC